MHNIGSLLHNYLISNLFKIFFLIQLTADGPCGPVVNHAKEGNKPAKLQEKKNVMIKVHVERNVPILS